MLNLYRLTWSHALGVYWLHCRAVTPETGDAWKAIYEKDDGAEYVISAKPPRVKPGMESRALHIATF